MKLLLDQNLSRYLVKRLESVFPGSAHVSQFSLEHASDSQVWEFAAQNGFVIVSRDSDFHQRSFLLGAPPKVVWISRGNCSTQDLEDLLQNSIDVIENFNESTDAAFLILD